MDQITKPPAVKPVKPKTPQLELGTGADSREASMQAAAPHIDANGAAYQADLAKVEALAIADRADDMEDEEFNWNTDDSIIVKEQRATAVYHNRLGELIVRQKAGSGDIEDTFIYVNPENWDAFVGGIAAKIKEGSE